MPPRRKQNRRNKAAEPVDPLADCVLPQRIINSILSRLPVKTLLRFKRVCIPWYNLAMDPAFVNLHYNRFSQLPKTTSPKIQLLSYLNLGVHPTSIFDPTKPEHLFMASCRGLVCLARPLITDHVLLWNPATRLWKFIPRPITNRRPDAEMVTLGFGCNQEGDDYKVVKIFSIKGEEMEVSVEVYSSKLDCWEMVGVGFNFRTLFLGQHTVVNGNPHWVVHNTNHEPVVLRFDSTTKKFTQIAVPLPMAAGMMMFLDWEGYLGGLHCITKDGDWVEWIEVWLYVNGGWMLKVKYGIRGGGVEVDRILDYNHGQGKIVGRSKSGALFEFDAKRKKVRMFGGGRGKRGVYKVFVHEESLAFVRGMRSRNLTTELRDNKRVDCILDGFFTCLIPNGGYTDLEIYYGLAR